MRIPEYTEVRGNWDATRFEQGQMTVGAHLDQVRAQFVEANQRGFMNTRDAIAFVQEHLPYLPALDQAAVAKQLIEESDREVHWPADRSGSTKLNPENQRQRQEIVLRTLKEFVEQARAPSLGVADLAKSLGLKLASPGGVPRQGSTQIGDHFVTSIEIPGAALHHPKPSNAHRTERGDVRREGDQLAFTGWAPTGDGYLQIHVQIDAEQSDGPLTNRELDAIARLSATLSKAYGELLSTKHIGTIGSEWNGDGVISRPFDQRRALANGSNPPTYVTTPLGEGQMHHGSPGHSSFSVGPVSFSVIHGVTAASLMHPLGNGKSFQLHTHGDSTSLQLLVPLPNGDAVYATLAPQSTRIAAEQQLSPLIELTRKVFG